MNADINEGWLQRQRKPTKERRELILIEDEARAGEKRKSKAKKSKTELEFEEVVKANWKYLSEHYLTTMPIPINLLSLPSRSVALRSLQMKTVETSLGPRMWAEGPNYPGKDGITCVFEVLTIMPYQITL